MESLIKSCTNLAEERLSDLQTFKYKHLLEKQFHNLEWRWKHFIKFLWRGSKSLMMMLMQLCLTSGSFLRKATSNLASRVFSHTIFPSREASTTPPALLYITTQVVLLQVGSLITVCSFFFWYQESYQKGAWGSSSEGAGGRKMSLSTMISGTWTFAFSQYSSVASSSIDSTMWRSSLRQRSNTEGSFSLSKHYKFHNKTNFSEV